MIFSQDFDQFELPAWHLKKFLSRPVTWNMLPAQHDNLFLPPAVDHLARAVRAALTTAEA